MTAVEVQQTISDGWRLGCGCLYLLASNVFEDTKESTVVVRTTATTPEKCALFHKRKSAVFVW